MKNARIVLIATAAITAVALLIILFLSIPQGFKIKLGLYITMGILAASGAGLYLIGLGGFRHQFKIGYWFMAAGMLCFAVAATELAFFETARSGSELTIQYYAALIPFFLFFTLYYLGIRKLASIVDIKSIFRSLPGVFTSAAALGIIAGLIPLPQFDNQASPQDLHIILAIAASGLTLLAASMVLLFRLMRNAGPLYKSAFAWNFYGFLAFFITQILDPSAFLPPTHWYVEYGSVLPFFLIIGFFIKGGFEFNKVPYKEQHLHETLGKTTSSLTPKTSIDIVVSLSQLVSNPKAVDPDLDKLRAITSKLQPGEAPSEEQQSELANLYKIIEDYLVNKEQARTYTAESLRESVEIQYRGLVNEPTFWRQFDSPKST